jgi:hypothetical protein
MKLRLPNNEEEAKLYEGYGVYRNMVNSQTEDEYVAKAVANVKRTTQAVPWLGVAEKELTEEEYLEACEKVAKSARKWYRDGQAKVDEAIRVLGK